MAINRWLWLPSLVLALLLHAVVLLLLVQSMPPSSPGAQVEGVGGLTVGYLGGGGSSALAVEVEEASATPSVRTPIEVAEVLPIVQKKSVIKPVVTKKPVARLQKPRIVPQVPVKQRGEAATVVVAAKSEPGRARSNRGSSHSSDGRGTGNSSMGGGRAGVIRDYQSAIRAWLEQHKRYPKRALRLRQQGTATVYFEIDRHGEVISHEIRESSGYALLDQAVSAMLRRASPLPTAPEELPPDRLSFVVPIAFNML